MKPLIRIVRPSSPGGEERLPENLKYLEKAGFRIRFPEPSTPPERWPITASAITERACQLTEALSDPECTIIMCAKGGYGASDLLPVLPWERLKSMPHKWLVGFSDISALQWGLYTALNWPSIHGPMPGSALWGLNGTSDLHALKGLLMSPRKSGGIKLNPINLAAKKAAVEGVLLGGCLSVIAALSGTPWFTGRPETKIFFFEDIGEYPGRLMRCWNQLIQNQSLQYARGIILGALIENGTELSQKEIRRELASRISTPCWESEEFGHVSPNQPLINGARAWVGHKETSLNWESP